MHPITLPIAELKSALSGLGKVINTRATLPLLHHLKVERTNDGWIALTGTDLDRFVTVRLEHPAEGSPVAVLVPYDQLQQSTKNCGKDERLVIEPTPEGPLIKFALAHNLGASKVKPLPVQEFPETPKIKHNPIPLPPEFRRAIHEAMDCASKDETRYVLNGTFIDSGTYVVGTNGRILYSANSFALPMNDSIIIPSHKFLGWKEFNNDGEWQMRADKEFFQLSTRRWRFISRHIEGQYPNWRQVVPDPKSFKTHLTIDPGKLEDIIKLIQRLPCHDEKNRTLGLEWKNKQFVLLAKADDEDPWLRVPVADIKADGPENYIFLDRRYMLQVLQFGLNTISIIDSISPARFHNGHGKQMIVMPVRAEADASPPPPPVHQPEPPPPPKPIMITTDTPVQPPPPSSGNKTPIEEAIDITLQFRDLFQNGLNLARDLNAKLKSINRMQRDSSKEFDALRSSLRSLQSFKL